MDQIMIGKFLKELRKEKNITQEQLADKLNVSGRTVSRWETGNNMPDISILVEMAELFDVSIPEIINGERKSEKMDDEIKNVAQSMSDYATTEKETLLKEVRKLSLIGLASLVIYLFLDTTKIGADNATILAITRYFRVLVFVITLMLPLHTTGLIYKFKRKKEIGIPKKVVYGICFIVAMLVALLIKHLLMGA
ncbi:Transcriptional regulator, contains XRE-family HTH domain [Ruminococcaceae bacterium KH2T8]|nr:Transcriptional regulator, contains XRE-family HTH domain [Ruminococcaceae bacterium KH2T8]